MFDNKYCHASALSPIIHHSFAISLLPWLVSQRFYILAHFLVADKMFWKTSWACVDYELQFTGRGKLDENRRQAGL
jgi:hypothetical protein